MFSSIFGGPIGGALTLGFNHRRVGERKLARTWLIIAVAVILAAIFGHAWLAWFGKELPRGAAIGLVFGFWAYAKQRFAPSANQPLASHWSVIKRTILGLVLTVAGYFALVLIPIGPISDLLDQQYTTPAGHVVEYDDGATHQDAQQVATALEKIGYFNETNTAQVRIVRLTNGMSLDFYPVDATAPALEEPARRVLSETADAGVLFASVRMCSSAWTCEKKYEQPVFGR